VSVAMGGISSGAALESADIVLMADDLGGLPWIIRHSRKTLARIRENIILAMQTKRGWLNRVSDAEQREVASAMIKALATHLIQRYGIDEVATWEFEVWNEPNLDFWGGVPKQETYFEL